MDKIEQDIPLSFECQLSLTFIEIFDGKLMITKNALHFKLMKKGWTVRRVSDH